MRKLNFLEAIKLLHGSLALFPAENTLFDYRINLFTIMYREDEKKNYLVVKCHCLLSEVPLAILTVRAKRKIESFSVCCALYTCVCLIEMTVEPLFSELLMFSRCLLVTNGFNVNKNSL